MPDLIYNTKTKKFPSLNLLAAKLWEMAMFTEIKNAIEMKRQVCVCVCVCVCVEYIPN